MKIILIIVAVLVLLMFARFVIPTLAGSVAAGIKQHNGQSYLDDCPDTPNCVSSEASRKSQKVARLMPINNPEKAISKLAVLIDSLPNMTVIKSDQRYLYATAKTPMLQYVDDVEFLLSDDQQSIQVRSASRLGRSDFGANAKRIAVIRAAAAGRL